jgi:hypothetical protein
MFNLITAQLKTYANIIMALIALAGIGFTHFKAFEYGEAHIQAKMDKQKENLDAQIQQVINAKNAVIAEQAEKYRLAETGYSGALDVLNQRLSELKTVPRNTSLCVAGSGSDSSSMPAKTANPAGAVIALKSFAGTCDAEFYAAALRDNLQCQALIDLVK